MPKSVSLICPSVPMSTLPGLTSRWVIPARCAVIRADATADPISAVSPWLSVPRSAMYDARLREGSSSMTT